MRRVLSMYLLLTLIFTVSWGQTLKPYTLGAQSSESFDVVKDKTRASLQTAGFSLLGEYQPAQDETRWVFVINSPGLIEAVQSVGGLTGFASALRVALTLEDGMVNVSYTNPIYLGNAYFQKAYPEVAHHFLAADKSLVTAMADLGTISGEVFGVEKGLTVKDIRHYHYMFGMEYFEDVVELNEFSSFSVGKSIIESKLSRGGNTKLIYAYEVPGKDLKLYGIALSGSTGEEQFLPIIDISTPKHTAFLPYEILLMGNTAVMMHGRYRIALSFPDLTMTTFSKIMSTPGNIEDLMRSVTE
ncbi:MAG: hypothetical protein U9Q77_13990 [Candidatus Marinimicrobia bacterium]|nr:hypothetical protein [Candidatus Neomarinimicrobiota bacterium]